MLFIQIKLENFLLNCFHQFSCWYFKSDTGHKGKLVLISFTLEEMFQKMYIRNNSLSAFIFQSEKLPYSFCNSCSLWTNIFPLNYWLIEITYFDLFLFTVKKWLKFLSRFPISSPLLAESHSSPFQPLQSDMCMREQAEHFLCFR